MREQEGGAITRETECKCLANVCVCFLGLLVFIMILGHINIWGGVFSNEEENLMESRILWNQRTGRKGFKALPAPREAAPPQTRKKNKKNISRGTRIHIYTHRYVRTWILVAFLMHDRDMIDMLSLYVHMHMHMDVICMYV